MTTRKTKPVLPAIRDQLATPLISHAYTWEEADRELTAAEAVIRAVRRWRRDPYAIGFAPVARALDRLDKLTHPTRRTP